VCQGSGIGHPIGWSRGQMGEERKRQDARSAEACPLINFSCLVDLYIFLAGKNSPSFSFFSPLYTHTPVCVCQFRTFHSFPSLPPLLSPSTTTGPSPCDVMYQPVDTPTPQRGSFVPPENDSLLPPSALRDSAIRDSAYRDSYLTDGSNQPLNPGAAGGSDPYRSSFVPGSHATFNKEEYDQNASASPVNNKRKRPLWVLIAIGLLVLVTVILAVILPVYFTVIKKDDNSSSSSNQGGSHTGDNHNNNNNNNGNEDGHGVPESGVITGGDGSTITMEDGTTFTYKNAFGGYWVQDPNDPFNMGARPQSWSPALNETWRWGVDIIRG
jgi:hypothetical protein